MPIVFTSYLNRHVVEKLEVVNKKWVRVNLQPGSSIDGSVSIIIKIIQLICILFYNYKNYIGNSMVQHR